MPSFFDELTFGDHSSYFFRLYPQNMMIVLYATRAVKFAAVVDSKGKLILAKSKISIWDTGQFTTTARPDTLNTILPLILS
jgi:hypothetical protein